MLKERRKDAGMTQRELSGLTGVPVRTIQNWERDVSKAAALPLSRIASALGCAVEDLLGEPQAREGEVA